MAHKPNKFKRTGRGERTGEIRLMLGVGGAGQSTSSPCSAMAAGCWLATATGDCQPTLRRAACLRIQVLQSGQVYLNRCSFSSPPASLVVQQVRNAGLCVWIPLLCTQELMPEQCVTFLFSTTALARYYFSAGSMLCGFVSEYRSRWRWRRCY